MQLIRYQNASDFLAACGAWLEAREAENLLLLGLAGNAERRPDRLKQEPYLAAVADDGRVAATAVCTPPREAVLSRAGAEAVGALVEDLATAHPQLSGVIAPAETAREFNRQWTRKTGVEGRLAYQHRYYQLTRLVPPPPRPGGLRQFTEAESGLFLEWFSGFQREMGPNVLGPEAAAQFCRTLIEDGTAYYWDDHGPASMAGWVGATSHGARVSAVYTPPERRNQGYAAACVAALSRLLLDSGRAFCGLAVNIPDPVPHRVYQKIGYVPVSDFDIIKL